MDKLLMIFHNLQTYTAKYKYKYTAKYKYKYTTKYKYTAKYKYKYTKILWDSLQRMLVLLLL